MKLIKDYFIQSVTEFPNDNIFLIREEDKCQKITRKEFLNDICSLGTALKLKAANNICIISENSYFHYLIQATALFGAGVSSSMNKDLPADELCSMIQKIDGDIVFYSKEYEDKAKIIAEKLPQKEFICLDKMNELLKKGAEEIKKGDNSFINCPVDAESPALIFFTSGTTGNQKAVMLSQKNVTTSAIGSASIMKMNRRDTMMMLLPVYHSFGALIGHYAMISGVTAGICSDFKRFIEDISFYKANKHLLTPSLTEMLAKKIEESGKSADEFFGFHLDWIVSGSAPLSPCIVQKMQNLGITIMNGYGTTECAPAISVNPPDKPKSETVGIVPEALWQVKIAPDGEICIRGGNVMIGYYKDSEANAEAIEDGWYKTGDIGCFDEEGYLSITGRKKNLIVLSSGKNIAPEKLEKELAGLDHVLEVLVYEFYVNLTSDIYTTVERKIIQKQITELNRGLATHERIQKLVLRDTPFERSSMNKIIRKYSLNV